MEWKGVMTLIGIGGQVKCEPLRHSFSLSLPLQLSLTPSPSVFSLSTDRNVMECRILPSHRITHLSVSQESNGDIYCHLSELP